MKSCDSPSAQASDKKYSLYTLITKHLVRADILQTSNIHIGTFSTDVSKTATLSTFTVLIIMYVTIIYF
jgi:hypothetical protein